MKNAGAEKHSSPTDVILFMQSEVWLTVGGEDREDTRVAKWKSWWGCYDQGYSSCLRAEHLGTDTEETRRGGEGGGGGCGTPVAHSAIVFHALLFFLFPQSWGWMLPTCRHKKPIWSSSNSPIHFWASPLEPNCIIWLRSAAVRENCGATQQWAWWRRMTSFHFRLHEATTAGNTGAFPMVNRSLN